MIYILGGLVVIVGLGVLFLGGDSGSSSSSSKDINKEVIFSDETENFRQPSMPSTNDNIKIWIRTARGDVDNVILHIGEKGLEAMKLQRSEAVFDFYLGVIPRSENMTYYYFELKRHGKKYYYTRIGLIEDISLIKNKNLFFVIIPGLEIPAWSKSAIYYKLHVDRFCNGDSSNHVLNNEYIYKEEKSTACNNWFEIPSEKSKCEFFGGDLQGIMDKMTYFKTLGVDAIILSPIFVSPSSFKNDSQDFFHIDPHYAKIVNDGGEVLSNEANDNINASKYSIRTTNKANLLESTQVFKKLVEKAHEFGLKIILQSSFGYCSNFHYYLDSESIYGDETGAYFERDSLYSEYFHFKKPNWPRNDSYETYEDKTKVKLNYETSIAMYADMLKAVEKWITLPYTADGYHLLEADKISNDENTTHKFLNNIRKIIKSANKNNIFIGEVEDDSSVYLRGTEYDSVYNKSLFLEELSFYLTGTDLKSTHKKDNLIGNSDHFIKSIKENSINIPGQYLNYSLIAISDYNASRFLTRTNGIVGKVEVQNKDKAEDDINIALLKIAYVIMFTFKGSPVIYYGDEAGICGFANNDSMRTYPWGKEDEEVLEFTKLLIDVRNDYECIKSGSLIFLNSNNEERYMSYARIINEEAIIVLVNIGDSEKNIKIPLWKANIKNKKSLEVIFDTNDMNIREEGIEYKVERGWIEVNIKEKTAIILAV